MKERNGELEGYACDPHQQWADESWGDAPEPADSLERIADELEAAEGWCDKNGDYYTGLVSITESKLREWSDRIRKLTEKVGECLDGHDPVTGMRLAELIDRPIAEAVYHKELGYDTCGRCGLDFAVFQPIPGGLGEAVFARHCPNCGAKVVYK